MAAVAKSNRPKPGNHGECIGKSSPFMAQLFRRWTGFFLPFGGMGREREVFSGPTQVSEIYHNLPRMG